MVCLYKLMQWHTENEFYVFTAKERIYDSIKERKFNYGNINNPNNGIFADCNVSTESA